MIFSVINAVTKDERAADFPELVKDELMEISGLYD